MFKIKKKFIGEQELVLNDVLCVFTAEKQAGPMH